MRRLLLTAALAAATVVLGPAAVRAQSTYTVQGYEIAINPATFAGTVSGGGSWAAQVAHAPLSTTPGTTTAITGGWFFIAPLGLPPVGGTITGGQLRAGSVTGLFSCTQAFTVENGTLSNGAWGGVLTHHGVRQGASCFPLWATFSGFASIG